MVKGGGGDGLGGSLSRLFCRGILPKPADVPGGRHASSHSAFSRTCAAGPYSRRGAWTRGGTRRTRRASLAVQSDHAHRLPRMVRRDRIFSHPPFPHFVFGRAGEFSV